jgi:hypothetical protein
MMADETRGLLQEAHSIRRRGTVRILIQFRNGPDL